jgi:mutual gliding-motility protein MglA
LFINWKLRELNLKIVYYGPAMSGKTTNLEAIHQRTKSDLRSDLISLKTKEDRTIYFDYMQLELNQIKGLKPRFNLYTVPGQVMYEATRKLVLQGVDGVVFVADSQSVRLRENIDSYRAMHRHLLQLGYDPESVPCVVQFNKQDLENRAPLSVLTSLFVANGTPWFEATATEGIGVFETLKTEIRLVVQQIRYQF